MWKVKILTLFPDLYPGPLAVSVVGNALDKYWSIESKNIRYYAKDRHKTVDDSPYGGGAGMVIRPDVLGDAIEDYFLGDKLAAENPIIYLSPRGKLLKQSGLKRYSQKKGLNIICGRFEGIDERIIMEYNVEELSIGDYVLSSGDIAALPFLDGCVRLLPGVLDSQDSLAEESFGQAAEYAGLLEYPHFTRPAVWKGLSVPEVLKSGNHQMVAAWRLEEAREKTKVVRPDLWDQFNEEKGD